MAKIKARKTGKRLPPPGMAVLDEDRLRGANGRFHLKPQEKVLHGPVAVETGNFSMRDVEQRLLRAMKTLRSMPDDERRHFVLRSGSPPHVQEQIDAYASVEAFAPKFKPSPADVSGYLMALSWMRHQPKHMWSIVWWRSFELSFGIIGQYLGQSDETARRKYREAITDAWQAANGIANRGAA